MCGPAWRIGPRAGFRRGRLRSSRRRTPFIAGEVVKSRGGPSSGRVDRPRSASSVQAGVAVRRRTDARLPDPIAELPWRRSVPTRPRPTAAGATPTENWPEFSTRSPRGCRSGPGGSPPDVTIMPLIAGTSNQTVLDLAEPDFARTPATASRDARPRGHGPDLKSKVLGQGGDMISNMIHVPQQLALGWLGRSGVLPRRRPVWADVAAAKKPQEFLKAAQPRSIGADVEVSNGASLALLLAGLRAYIDQSAPNLTTWKNREHMGQRHVRIARPAAPPGQQRAQLHPLLLRRPALAERPSASGSSNGPSNASRRNPSLFLAPAQPRGWADAALQVSRRGFEALAGRDVQRSATSSRTARGAISPSSTSGSGSSPTVIRRAPRGGLGRDAGRPGGGTYVECATRNHGNNGLGHPGEPKPGHELNNPVSRFDAAALGFTFGDGGLRASPRSSYARTPDRRPRETAANISPAAGMAPPRLACTKTPPADHPAGNRGRPRTESCSEPRRPSARHRSRRR